MDTAMSDVEIWNKVLDEVVNTEVFNTQYTSYLRSATVASFDSGSLVLAFPNEFTKELIDKSKILPFLELSLQGTMDTPVAIRTSVVSSDSPNQAQDSKLPQPESAPSYFPNASSQPEKSSVGRFEQPQSSQYATTATVLPIAQDDIVIPDTTVSFYTKYTFDSFIVGESNKFAHGAALTVAENPSRGIYNPLFIYGKSGLGKTHLLCAIKNYINQNYPTIDVLYFSAKEFVDDVVGMGISKNWGLFDKKYSSRDVILIDDIQYLEGKEGSIERVFQLFNDFITKNKQVVLSADRAPRDLNMDERMTSRFASGAPIDIQPPAFETKVAILRNYRDHYIENQYIGDDVLEYIATISSSNIREIEGSISKLNFYYNLKSESLHSEEKQPMLVDDAREILKDFFPETNSKIVSIQLIQREVEKKFHITHEEMIGAKRSRNIVWPRQIAMYLSRTMTDESYPAIGKKFGGRDHTTILHGVETVEHQIKENKLLYDEIDKLQSHIREQA